MAYSGLESFITYLGSKNEIERISVFADPCLEITEITDRVTKNNGKALLFENNGTRFPLLINAFGSDQRMAAAMGRKDLNDATREIEEIFNTLSADTGSFAGKLRNLPEFARLARLLPYRSSHRGACQDVVIREPDLGMLPVLKCWPYDGGRFITLPMVHTVHPETGKPNVGMYRMQVIDKNTTAMHWQRHKTGANHFEAWKKAGKIMPVTVALGGDPVFTYASTAPLPENISEYVLAGFLRKKRVRLVKCLTNQLYVPDDADIVIEGFVDPSEDLFCEGPFGDHTGFYSLSDFYPRFHVTCITHRKNAIYPATIVGVPPMEDAWLAKATEKLFLAPVKMALLPEVSDFHMPDAGVAHNLVIVKISKDYPGQGMKVLNSLFGAGQMMFSKYIVVVSGDINIRAYRELIMHIFSNIDVRKDLLFSKGPLDVLDHSSDAFSFGGKLGIDATIKLTEEGPGTQQHESDISCPDEELAEFCRMNAAVRGIDQGAGRSGIPLLVLTVDQKADHDWLTALKLSVSAVKSISKFRLILVVDHTVDPGDHYTVAWQVLGNTDPMRDHQYAGENTIIIDGTIKAFRKEGFARRWPNVVCSADETIKAVDAKWKDLNLGPLPESPSLKIGKLKQAGTDEIVI